MNFEKMSLGDVYEVLINNRFILDRIGGKEKVFKMNETELKNNIKNYIVNNLVKDLMNEN